MPYYPIKKVVKRGLIVLGVGLIFFYLGLDEFNDYLRIWHGIWHLHVSYSALYIWHFTVPINEEFSWHNLFNLKTNS